MQLTYCNYDLCGVKLYRVFRETLLLLKDFVQLATVNKRHDEVETSLRLEEVFHTAKEWVISLKQNVLFKRSGLNLVIFNQNILPDSLDCKLSVSTRQLGEVDTAKSALA